MHSTEESSQRDVRRPILPTCPQTLRTTTKGKIQWEVLGLIPQSLALLTACLDGRRLLGGAPAWKGGPSTFQYAEAEDKLTRVSARYNGVSFLNDMAHRSFNSAVCLRTCRSTTFLKNRLCECERAYTHSQKLPSIIHQKRRPSHSPHRCNRRV